MYFVKITDMGKEINVRYCPPLVKSEIIEEKNRGGLKNKLRYLAITGKTADQVNVVLWGTNIGHIDAAVLVGCTRESLVGAGYYYTNEKYITMDSESIRREWGFDVSPEFTSELQTQVENAIKAKIEEIQTKK